MARSRFPTRGRQQGTGGIVLGAKMLGRKIVTDHARRDPKLKTRTVVILERNPEIDEMGRNFVSTEDRTSQRNKQPVLKSPAERTRINTIYKAKKRIPRAVQASPYSNKASPSKSQTRVKSKANSKNTTPALKRLAPRAKALSPAKPKSVAAKKRLEKKGAGKLRLSVSTNAFLLTCVRRIQITLTRDRNSETLAEVIKDNGINCLYRVPVNEYPEDEVTVKGERPFVTVRKASTTRKPSARKLSAREVSSKQSSLNPSPQHKSVLYKEAVPEELESEMASLDCEPVDQNNVFNDAQTQRIPTSVSKDIGEAPGASDKADVHNGVIASESDKVEDSNADIADVREVENADIAGVREVEPKTMEENQVEHTQAIQRSVQMDEDGASGSDHEEAKSDEEEEKMDDTVPDNDDIIEVDTAAADETTVVMDETQYMTPEGSADETVPGEDNEDAEDGDEDAEDGDEDAEDGDEDAEDGDEDAEDGDEVVINGNYGSVQIAAKKPEPPAVPFIDFGKQIRNALNAKQSAAGSGK